MQTVTLRGKDFSTIHNALCDLRSVSTRCSDAMAREIDPIIFKLEQGLEDVYQQENAEVDRRLDHYESVARENGFVSVWSIYDIDDLSLPHCYGEDINVQYNNCMAKVEGHTWIDLWRAADKVIRESGDDHHIFIECFLRDQTTVLKLSTGS